MAVHIDVVENDWLGGRQTVVARLSVQDGTYRVESQDPTRWLRVLGLPENPPDLRDEGHALEFLSNIAHKLRGTYVFATEPHPDEKCEFPEGYALLKAARNQVGEGVEAQATAPAIARRA
jgi:hypothetical protein